MKLQCSLLWLVLLASGGFDVCAFRIRDKKLHAVTSDDSVRVQQHGGKLLTLRSEHAHHHEGLSSLTTRINTTGLQHPPPDNKLMDAITRMQVETCVHMKKLYSDEFDAFKRCLELLSKLCQPGDDLKMDGDHHEQPTGEGFCKTFFGARKRLRDKAKKRAKECVEISKEQDKSSDEYKSCLQYMTKLCDPGEDMLMDGDEKENPTGTGVCQGFFRKESIKANEAAMEDDETEGDGEEGGEGNAGGANKDGEGAEGGGGGESEGAQEGNEGKATIDRSMAGAPAPAPGGMASPEAGGGVASPEAGGGTEGAGDGGEAEGDSERDVEGDSEGDAEGASGDGSEKTGTQAGRHLPPFAMKEDTGLQEQGFEGPNIEHDDMKTHTGDWRKEYGPNHPNYQKIVDICLKHPKNPWCRSHLSKIRGAQEIRLTKSIAEQVASSMFVTFLVFFVQIR